MAKSQIKTNSQKEKKMEFKKKDEIVIIDEKKNTMFETKKDDPLYPCDDMGKAKTQCSKRWLESLSDCA